MRGFIYWSINGLYDESIRSAVINLKMERHGPPCPDGGKAAMRTPGRPGRHPSKPWKNAAQKFQPLEPSTGHRKEMILKL
jgi:hypothetical protein